MTTTANRPKDKGRSGKNKGRKNAKRNWRTAATSDVHELYELSVQDPEAEVDFIEQAWKEQRGRTCRHIREDFCGTAAASAAWVKHRVENTALAVDIDQSVLDWGAARAAERLNDEQRSRLHMLRGDVTTVRTDPVECVLAMNFSYFLFKTRDDLRYYFNQVRSALVGDGLFLLDAYGGSESFSELEEERDLDGFTYVWDQNMYNPITGEARNHIHFRFPDGTEIKEAFSYDWRLWTLPEIQEILLEAGFKDVVVYWEGTDEETSEGDGEFRATRTGEACEGWIAYLVAKV